MYQKGGAYCYNNALNWTDPSMSAGARMCGLADLTGSAITTTIETRYHWRRQPKQRLCHIYPYLRINPSNLNSGPSSYY